MAASDLILKDFLVPGDLSTYPGEVRYGAIEEAFEAARGVDVARIHLGPVVHEGDLVFDLNGVPPAGGSLALDRVPPFAEDPHVFHWDPDFYRLSHLCAWFRLPSPPEIRGTLRLRGNWLRVQGLRIKGDLVIEESCAGALVVDCTVEGEVRVLSHRSHVLERLRLGPRSKIALPEKSPTLLRYVGELPGTIEGAVGDPDPEADAKVSGKIWHVRPNGGAMGDGSPSHPFGSLALAWRAARSGDALHLAEGIYGEDMVFRSNGKVRDVSLIGAEGDKAIVTGTWVLRGEGLRVEGIRFHYRNRNAVVFGEGASGCRLISCRFERDEERTVVLQNPVYVVGPGARGNKVVDCDFDGRPPRPVVFKHLFEGGTNAVGIQVAEGRGNFGNEFQRNRIRGYFYGIQLGHGNCFDFRGGNTVRGNHIEGCSDGVHVKTDGDLIEGNRFTGNLNHGITLRQGEGTRVMGNEFRDNPGRGLRIIGGGHRIEGNFFAGCGLEAIRAADGGFEPQYPPVEGVVVARNRFVGNPMGHLLIGPGNGMVFEGNQFEDPPGESGLFHTLVNDRRVAHPPRTTWKGNP